MHVVQRGINRAAVFFEHGDYQAYLRYLEESTTHYRVAVHAWCLMTNHVHLLVTPLVHGALPKVFARLGQRYVSMVNRRYRRTGALWEGRYRASLVDSDEYLLACCRYIELNPVRAGMVEQPGAYRWSSYATAASGEPHPLHTPHVVYTGLGTDAARRRQAYRELFADNLNEETVQAIREALNRNHVLGDKQFRHQVEAMLGRQIGTGRRGRPRAASASMRNGSGRTAAEKVPP